MKKNCKECYELKDLSEFYIHPQGLNGVLGRCKECIKKGRRSNREKIMSRKRDRYRFYNNKERRKYSYNKSKEWAEKFPDKIKAYRLVSNFYKRKGVTKPTNCCICNSKERIHMHHEDYNFPERVYALCNICHSNRHAGNLDLNNNKELILDFSNKRNTIIINGMTTTKLSEKYNIPTYLIRQRYKKGWDFEKIIYKKN